MISYLRIEQRSFTDSTTIWMVKGCLVSTGVLKCFVSKNAMQQSKICDCISALLQQLRPSKFFQSSFAARSTSISLLRPFGCTAISLILKPSFLTTFVIANSEGVNVIRELTFRALKYLCTQRQLAIRDLKPTVFPDSYSNKVLITQLKLIWLRACYSLQSFSESLSEASSIFEASTVGMRMFFKYSLRLMWRPKFRKTRPSFPYFSLPSICKSCIRLSLGTLPETISVARFLTSKTRSQLIDTGTKWTVLPSFCIEVRQACINHKMPKSAIVGYENLPDRILMSFWNRIVKECLLMTSLKTAQLMQLYWRDCERLLKVEMQPALDRTESKNAADGISSAQPNENGKSIWFVKSVYKMRLKSRNDLQIGTKTTF